MSHKLNPSITKIILGYLTPVLLCTSSYADKLYNNRGELNTNISLGYLNADIKEIVYDEDEVDYKISHLDWKTNAAILNAQITYNPLSFLSLSVNGWTNIPSFAHSKMDDYDWLIPEQQSPSHHSWHSDTHLSYAHGFDTHLKAWILNQTHYGVGLMAGYQYHSSNLQARGGCYSYNNGEDIGCSPEGQPAIDYTQTYKTPYIGMAAGVKYAPWDFDLEFKYSDWVKVSDVDYHYNRTLKFESTHSRSAYYGISAKVGYWLTDHVKLFLGSQWNRFSQARASTTITDTQDQRIAPGGIEGMSQKYYLTTLGVAYTF